MRCWTEITWLSWLLKRTHFFSLRNSCFCCKLWVITHLHSEVLSKQFSGFESWAESTTLCTSQYILLLLSAVTLSVCLSDVVPVAALHASTMFDRCCAMLQIMSCFSPFPSFQLSVQYLWKLTNSLQSASFLARLPQSGPLLDPPRWERVSQHSCASCLPISSSLYIASVHMGTAEVLQKYRVASVISSEPPVWTLLSLIPPANKEYFVSHPRLTE